MIKPRFAAIPSCAVLLLMLPNCAVQALPPSEERAGAPLSPAERVFAVTADGWAGYRDGAWRGGSWNFYAYAGLWTVAAVPEVDDPAAWARGRIAAEIVGVGGLEVEEGAFEKAATLVKLGKKVSVIFRADQEAGNPRIVWNDGIVASAKDPAALSELSAPIFEAINVAASYDLHPGWVTGNYFRTIAAPVEHPIDAAAVAMNLGCDWMVWANGQNDDLTTAYAKGMLAAAAPAGSSPMLMLAGERLSRDPWHWTPDGWSIMVVGSDNFFDYQDVKHELKYYVDLAHDGHGYVFASPDTYQKVARINTSRQLPNPITFDGIDTAEPQRVATAPFLGGGDRNRPRAAGDTGGPSSMVVMLPRGQVLTRESLFEAVKARHAVLVSGGSNFSGPGSLPKALGLLLLSRRYMEDQFHGSVSVSARIEGWDKISVTVANRGKEVFVGGLNVSCDREKCVTFPDLPAGISIAPGTKQVFESSLQSTAAASGKDLAVLVTISDKGGKAYKRTMARLRFPRTVSGYRNLYAAPGKWKVPFTIWNGSGDAKITWNAEVTGPSRASLPGSTTITPHTSGNVDVELDLKPGEYHVTLSALGQSTVTYIRVSEQKGSRIKHWLEDMNGDGKQDIFFENDHVKGVILLQGGRMIRYWNKRNGDDVFCEIWPQSPPGRDKATDTSFWPYGGLEEFVSYPTIDGHTWFDHRIVRDDEQALAVELTTEVHRQKIKKTYTVWAGSGLLELRYELLFNDRSIRIIGVNPILALGEAADAHDVTIIPTAAGLVEHRYDPDRMHGGRYDTSEGWVAHWDERERSGITVAFPLADTLFMHLWNNTPQNGATLYYYTELQPWFLIDHDTTTYYTCYFLPWAGPWQDGLKMLKEMGIATGR